MRASVLLVVIVGLFAASHAALDFGGLGESLKQAGVSLVNNLVQKGKELLLQAGQQILGKLTANGILGKREQLGMKEWFSQMKDKFGDAYDGAKDKASKLFHYSMDKLKALSAKWMAKLGHLKDTKEVDKSIDEVVDAHKKEHKRILSELLQKGKDLLGALSSKVKDVFTTLKGKASELASGLLQKGADVLIGKRATLSDHLSNIGNALSGAVAPFKDIVSGLGNTLKGHFSNLVDTVKGHVNTLKGKLSGHVDDLKKHGGDLLQHGKNALGALSEVVSDILKQTISNAQPAIDGLSKTAADAGSTVLNHFTGGSN